MAKLHALNTGKSDCLLLELPGEKETAWVLIDGGSKKEPVTLPLDYMRRLGVAQLDLMVMTHLHQDHLGYLPDIAAALPVRAAVLPYPPLPLAAERMPAVLGNKRAADVVHYHALNEALHKQQSRVYTAYPFQEIPVFSMGDYRMRAVYPAVPTASRVFSFYENACNLSNEEAAARYDSVRDDVNGESSMWLLEKGNTPLAVFCGDGYASALDAFLAENPSFSCPLIKLSHHGRNDKGKVYYTREQVQHINPNKIVVCSDVENDAVHHAAWETLCPGAALYVTGLTKTAYVLDLSV